MRDDPFRQLLPETFFFCFKLCPQGGSLETLNGRQGLEECLWKEKARGALCTVHSDATLWNVALLSVQS